MIKEFSLISEDHRDMEEFLEHNYRGHFFSSLVFTGKGTEAKGGHLAMTDG